MLTRLKSSEAAARWLAEWCTGTLRTDSRQVQPGDAFIAWPGYARDGREYVAAALAAGAATCLVEEADVDRFGFVDARVASLPGLKARTGEIAAAFFGKPTDTLDVIAITGTNGKTSSAWWIAQALAGLNKRCGVVGTLGIGEPPKLDYNGLTTPDPVMLQRELRGFVARGFSACAIEASSIGIAERRLDGCEIRVAVFTNFTQDHLDYHGDMDAYWEAKAELFRWPGLGAAVVNIDDLHGASLVAQLIDRGTGALDIWTTSADGSAARLMAQNIHHGAEGLSFEVVEQGAAPQSLATQLIGQYNVANLLGVIGALRALGMTLAEAVDACRGLHRVPCRMERIALPGRPLAVVDYAHTPDALDKALAGLQPLAAQRGGQLWCVFGCGGDRDPTKRPLMAAVAEKNADRVVVTSDNPRSESPAAIVSQILRGLSRPEAAWVEPDRARAIARVLAEAAPQDVVLIAGKGHEAWQEIGGEKFEFSDRLHAAAALGATASRSAP